MPHHTTWEQDGIYWQFYGVVDEKECFESDAELYNDPRSDHIKYWIWDGSNIEKLAIAEIHAELIAATDAAATENNQKIKGAIIANNTNTLKLMEVYISMSMELESSLELKVFQTLEDARKWVSP